MFIDDTIAAIATAPGEGGIGIIRISGSNSLPVAEEIFKSVSGKKISEYNLRTLIYGNIYDGEKRIDEVLVAYMKGPNSYTGEDVIEINCHGGFISVKKILELILTKDVRLAEAGEFTKRAFLNGRIDLSQAEAVIDVIKSKTDKAQEVAQNQLEGALAKKIRSLRNNVTEVLAQLEVSIDFSDEDVEDVTYKEIEDKSLALRDEIKKLYDSAESGKILRDGLKTVIIGKPNVGKSSLLNSILGENRAIVTEIAGTTRDVIEEFVNIKGIPLKIVDTAGIRETEDIVEKIGVQKSKESIDSADLVIIVLDSSKPLTDEDLEILENAKSKKTIVLLNKIDLEQAIDQTVIEEIVGKDNIIKISALKNEGIEQIHDKIEAMVFAGDVKSSSSVVITNSRHKDALFKAYNSINDAIAGIDQRLPYDFIEVDFKNIWDYLGYINGDTVQEDLLDTIFSNFCIGK
ncbi:tRNA uridine-5-carboxymethylaminomethyl(34) synthesis GTPase MnmE [Intestinibacter sp.]|uniref:tRNA uridine-5-carboxymethylaminomethyl(34) synthesis GTPase MnmE n=1 Tax=Intestinibacter sp. TaxID=1965304 RepID=UPI002A9183C2|nr:tRNA uridine-5-carboxymethylaminomethyl(34) synthesis GTPase MnmE [Intestinibacter sp.]MDY5213481.1 tRNA uridine-5-carboxymethylaminomethyl(34) synthesis GTPase MnmE [Intestinibacter sp.]